MRVKENAEWISTFPNVRFLRTHETSAHHIRQLGIFNHENLGNLKKRTASDFEEKKNETFLAATRRGRKEILHVNKISCKHT